MGRMLDDMGMTPGMITAKENSTPRPIAEFVAQLDDLAWIDEPGTKDNRFSLLPYALASGSKITPTCILGVDTL